MEKILLVTIVLLSTMKMICIQYKLEIFKRFKRKAVSLKSIEYDEDEIHVKDLQ
jgi:hypothetical protein